MDIDYYRKLDDAITSLYTSDEHRPKDIDEAAQFVDVMLSNLVAGFLAFARINDGITVPKSTVDSIIESTFDAMVAKTKSIASEVN